jgi:hypothetical protein
MNAMRHLTSAAFLVVAACATPVADGSSAAARQLELREFQRAQQVFREENSGSFQFDFPGHGRVTVREITLDGFPGSTYLLCRFHYQNRTEQPVVQTWVSLDVLDAENNVAGSQTCHCIVPVPIPIAREAYYSDELRVDTGGVHLKPGWKWRIRCVSDLEQADEPLNPPVPERQVLPPMQIKDRNWPYPRQN